MAPQLSIIVPVYNVEKYIHTCVESIFKQGLDDETFEVIIINDGTPDRSMEMIADIIEAHQNIQIVNQENQGVSIARNHGLEIAKGEYIQFLDNDDLLIENSVPYLLNLALASKAELVIGDFIKMNDEEIAGRFPGSIHQSNGEAQKKDGKDLLAHPMYSGYSCVWRTLYRKEFLDKNNIRFIPNIYYEDVPFTRQCFFYASKCLRVKWLMTIYRQRPHSITTSNFTKKKGMDHCIVIKKMWELSKEKELSLYLQKKIQNDTFSYFSMLLYNVTSSNLLSRSEQMEILNNIKQLVPDLSFHNSVKQWIVSFLYQRMPNTYMKLRIFYANYLQNIFWTIGDTIRNKDTIRNIRKCKT